MNPRFASVIATLALLCCVPPPAPPPDSCTGTETCGSVADCPALCATVARLGCAAQWQIDESDGACLNLCQTATPGLCPALAAQQATCAEVDRATECQR
jgi:hypothetical protein